MTAASELLFVDFEASSLEPGGFPIEIGWCAADGQGEAHLIRPAPGWIVWSAASQGIHGITRERLLAEGEPVEAVARRAASAFSPKRAVVLSDAPPFDQAWLDRLFIAGGIRMRVRLLSMWQVLRRVASHMLREAGVPDAAAPDLLRDIGEGARHADNARGPVVHRALADAQRNAAIWRDVIHRTEAAAARWRAVKHRIEP
jgi:hypothetical protein